MHNTISTGDESTPSRENSSIASAHSAIPTTVSQRVPILSDSRPLTGPHTAMAMEPGAISKPALAGSY